MTPARYRATVRKLQAAYDALAIVIDTAEYFDSERISGAMEAISRVPGTLRVQVCGRCNPRGYYDEPGDEFRSYSCDHPDVEILTVRPVTR
jgi:hypothetical protein